MNTVTISTKEYRKLLGTKRTSSRMLNKKSPKNFAGSAFGVLKNSFGKTSSAAYLARLRKSWR